ncbi:hypothetical protein L6452_08828 [Arctium lappa]|uniref:Uncharacterized protein n=1 Tax=Arctium lappa TaxID=4217 RepID=A0ACB9DJG7_ARCLA|nr:hypothetical protein L6452_08828 [Arctium lappa]
MVDVLVCTYGVEWSGVEVDMKGEVHIVTWVLTTHLNGISGYHTAFTLRLPGSNHRLQLLQPVDWYHNSTY